MPNEAPEQNLPGPDGQQIKTGDNSPVQLTRFPQPQKSARELIIGIILALSIMVNIALLLMYRYDAQERDLDRYDDTVREKAANKEIEGLKAEVSMLDKLIQAYGLREALQETEQNGRTHHHP